MESEGLRKKRMGATYVGVRRAHSFLWSLSSPQQPLETEDSPTVSLAPQYTSQRLCRAIDSKVFTRSPNLSLELSQRTLFRPAEFCSARRKIMKNFQSGECRNCIQQVLLRPKFPELQSLDSQHTLRFRSGFHPQS